ncbi:MAG TPA: universal stress protein [Acetobacteraceae bacterium]|nr:universal stress protein [Acetobacteraceae bacterium]
MSLKDILVCLDAGPASAGRLNLAVALARAQGSELSAAFLDGSAGSEHRDAATLLAGLAAPSPRAIELSRDVTLAADQEECFRRSQCALGAHGGWDHVEQGDLARLIHLARTPDLVVMGQISPHAWRSPWWRIDDIIVACGRPVLLVPYVGSYSEVGRRVLIAWDCSREASRALHDALPIIKDALTVTIVTVRSSGSVSQHDRASINRVLRHLARHDVDARADHMVRGDTAVADVLLSAAMDCAADLIVAGGYHRAPWREALAGGVSRSLLDSMTVPVLMSH